MCSGSYPTRRLVREFPVYKARTLTHRDMPEFPITVSTTSLQSAFPIAFENLLVSMFLNDDGFIGYEDDDVETLPEHWYGLSWACIHRDITTVWRPYAKVIRGNFYSACWRYVRSLGKENRFFTKERSILFWLAVLDPVPDSAFRIATERLIRQQCLEHREEDGVHMYYPLPRLAERLAAASQP